jgi:2-dehydropantoate 2-reductase
MGTGAVGGYFGALLSRAGHDVSFIARGAHLNAIRDQGLRLEGPRGDFTVSALATDAPGEIGTVDVVLFCVKQYDAESAATLIKPLVSRGGVCITLMNGVDGQDRIAPVLGAERVIGGLAFVSGVVERPGTIRYSTDMSAIVFGETDGRASERLVRFRDACTAAGFGAEIAKDIRAAQWQKFVGLATNTALTALTRQPAGYVYHDPDMLPIARASIDEVVSVARAMGIALAADISERTLAALKGFPAGMYASMANDLMRGRRLELESLSGYIVRKGKELGVATPVHAMAYACLKPYLYGAAGGNA